MTTLDGHTFGTEAVADNLTNERFFLFFIEVCQGNNLIGLTLPDYSFLVFRQPWFDKPVLVYMAGRYLKRKKSKKKNPGRARDTETIGSK